MAGIPKRFRRGAVIGGALVVVAAVLWLSARQSDALEEIVVYETPTCGCCAKWAEHLRENGFSVRTEDARDLSEIKRRYAIDPAFASCHTAIVDDYVVEGHVPADVIKRLLRERPDVVGIAVPGMPLGSPGMEASRTEPYEILTFDEHGNAEVFARR